MRQPWTTERDAELRRLWELRTPWSEIAAALGCTVAAINIRVYRLKLRRGERYWADAERRTLLSMWAAGRRVGTIALALGRSDWSVRAQARQMGLLGRRRVLTPRLRAAAVTMMRDGRSCMEVCRRTGLAGPTVCRLRKAEGIPPAGPDEHRRMTVRGLSRAELSGGVAATLAVQERLASEGWPLGTLKAEAAVFGALEAHGPLTTGQIAARLGLASHGTQGSSYLRLRLRAMWMRNWLVRLKTMPAVYDLAPAVRRGQPHD